jgi:hypothetical protein
MLLEHLELEGAHPRVRAEYALDIEGLRTERTVGGLFWMLPEHIRLARRFVMDFMDGTDNIALKLQSLQIGLLDLIFVFCMSSNENYGPKGKSQCIRRRLREDQ